MEWVLCFDLALLTICVVFMIIIFVIGLAIGERWAWITAGIIIAGLILLWMTMVWHNALFV